MNTFLVLLLIAAMIAVVVALIRGIVSFLALREFITMTPTSPR